MAITGITAADLAREIPTYLNNGSLISPRSRPKLAVAETTIAKVKNFVMVIAHSFQNENCCQKGLKHTLDGNMHEIMLRF